jgi:hypothetical protein
MKLRWFYGRGASGSTGFKANRPQAQLELHRELKETRKSLKHPTICRAEKEGETEEESRGARRFHAHSLPEKAGKSRGAGSRFRRLFN